MKKAVPTLTWPQRLREGLAALTPRLPGRDLAGSLAGGGSRDGLPVRLSNRTYAGPSVPVLRAALALADADAIPDRSVPVSQGVREAYQVVRGVWAAGTVAGARPALAMNFLMDRDEARWARDLARLKAEVGACPTTEAVTPLTTMEATFTWTCEHGRIKGGFLLAPTRAVSLQDLDFEVAKP